MARGPRRRRTRQPRRKRPRRKRPRRRTPASRFDRPVTAADIAALGDTGRPLLARGLAEVSLPLRGRLASMRLTTMPTTTKDVRLLAKYLGRHGRLGPVPEFFSYKHTAFTDDDRLILDCLTYVAIESNAASWFPAFPDAIAGAPASEWMFDFIDAMGPDALMARPRSGDPLQGTDPLQQLRDAMWPQLWRWFWDARLGATRQQRKTAREQLQRIGSELAGDARGRRGRPHDRFSVQLTYALSLYRVARAHQLLGQLLRHVPRHWSWVRTRDDAVDLVMEACDLTRYDDPDDCDVSGAFAEGVTSVETIARMVTGKIYGMSDRAGKIVHAQVRNILAKPIRLPSAE